ncbi:hypothetical protein AEAC466_07525 [Asticcacaulis sp. AC466]|nr:hypothetical protein AEAC466_07525 [Asticcacaulis sp. AC466]
MHSCAPPPEAPLILKGTDGRRRVVVAVDRAARQAGLYPGMALTKAQALVAGLAIHDADPQADRDGLERLAQWALRTFSPLVAVDPPDGLVMDVTGAAHLKGGETALLDGLIQALAAQGIEARAALAGTWGAAHALARFSPGSSVITTPGEEDRRLPDLPIAALRLPADTVHSLNLLGFQSIGELAAQPRAPLVHRFGPDIARRLDQLFGRLNEPIDPVHLPDITEVTRVFAEPIGAPETLARYTGKLTAQICDRLDSKNLGATQLDLMFHRVDNRIEAVRIGMARPVRDAGRLTRLLCDQLETVDPGFGIERMRLVVTGAEPLALAQSSTLDTPGDTAGAGLSSLIDTLSNRIGAERIYRLYPAESDVPERCAHRRSPLEAEDARTDIWPRHWPRPVRLFARPEPITTLGLLPDYPPRAFTWRGARHQVIAADGPERIFGEWWKRDPEIHAVRDYFRVEIETGARYWLFRSGDGEDHRTGTRGWFLHGVFA